MWLRIKTSILAGAIFFIALFVLSFCLSRRDAAQWGRGTTILQLKSAQSKVLAYQQKYGKLPRTLEVAGDICFDQDSISCGPEDAYGFPLDYEIHGSTFTITALGRDGKPGGSGMEEDISTDDLPRLDPNAGQMNLYDYFDQGHSRADPFGANGRQDAVALVIAAFSMSLFSFFFIKEADLTSHSYLILAGKFVGAGVSSIALILLIALLHII